jgi:hypothetical protein
MALRASKVRVRATLPDPLEVVAFVEFLVALGVVVALVADALSAIEILRSWRLGYTHRRMEAEGKKKPGGNRAS